MILIGPSYLKKKVLGSTLTNTKYIDEYELQDKYLYTYRDGILTYLDKKYGYTPELSKIILNNLYDIELINYNNSKLNNLVNIKKDLIDNKYIIFNNNFKSFIKNKDIKVLPNFFSKRIIKILSKLNVSYVKEDVKYKDNINVYEFNTLEEEVIHIASSIIDLIESGVSINKIYVNRLADDYRTTMIRIFDFYNIPNNFKSNSLYDLEVIKTFINSIELNTSIMDINDLLDKSDINDNIKNMLVAIFNKYVNYKTFNDIKEEIIYELKNTSINLNKLENYVREKDYKNYSLSEDEYIFIMGINEGNIPSLHRDDSYFSDIEKQVLDIDTTLELNRLEKDYFINYINTNNNVYLSYKLRNKGEEFNKSDILNELSNINIIKSNYKYDNRIINEILLGKRLDDYVKYNEKASDLSILNNYEIDYMTYDNKYNYIDFSTIKKQINNKLNISPTSSDIFYRCKFRYLLSKIYKLEDNKKTIVQDIGTLFHAVLCRYFKDKDNLDTIIDEELKTRFTSNTKKENFYTNKYRVAIKKLVGIIENQLDRSDFTNTLFEEWFSIEKENDLNIKIVGQIDKILTFKDKDSTYVIVVDYKTGTPHSLETAVYGINMQLAYYLYLIYNTNKIKNPKFAGMYLQPIMDDILNSSPSKTYDELISDYTKLKGYTLNNIDILNHIDKNVEPGNKSTSYINGIRITNDNEFYKNCPTIEESKFKEIMSVIEDNINNAIKDINNCDFSINPKSLKGKNIGCEYCPYMDICYVNNSNIEYLDKDKMTNFLGGDTSENKTDEFNMD